MKANRIKDGDATSRQARQNLTPPRFSCARQHTLGLGWYASLPLILLFALPARATQFWLRNDASSVAGYKVADIARGTGVTTSVTDTVAGPTAGVQCTATASGTALAWITEPLSSGVTISNSTTANIWALESSGNA